MKTQRLAFFAAVLSAAIAPAQSNEIDKVTLVCPDRSLRMSDIELAVNAAQWKPTRAQATQMLERARSVCAAGLSAVALHAPEQLAPEGALASSTR